MPNKHPNHQPEANFNQKPDFTILSAALHQNINTARMALLNFKKNWFPGRLRVYEVEMSKEQLEMVIKALSKMEPIEGKELEDQPSFLKGMFEDTLKDPEEGVVHSFVL